MSELTGDPGPDGGVTTRSPIDLLLAEAGVVSLKLHAIDGDSPREKAARTEILQRLSSAVSACPPAPCLTAAERLFCYAAVILVQEYSAYPKALDALDATRALLISVRRGPPKTPERSGDWRQRAGHVQ